MRYANTIFGAVLLTLMMVSTSASAQLSIIITPMSAFRLTTDPTASQTLTIYSTWPRFWAHANVCVSMAGGLLGTGTNPDTIPGSAVWVQVENGNYASIVSGSTNCGVAGTTQVKTGIDTSTGTRTDTLNFYLKGYPPTLAPDTYTGTINFYVLVF